MSNPAALLLETFRLWNDPKKPAHESRSGAKDELWPSDMWLRHRLAVRHLDAIAETLAELKSLDEEFFRFSGHSWDGQLNQWTAIVFAYPRGWKANGSGAIATTALAALERLALRFRDLEPEVRPDGLEGAMAFARSVMQTLDEDASIPVELRVHVANMVDHVQWCIRNYRIAGYFEVSRACERLLISVNIASHKSGAKHTWKSLVETWVSPFVTGTVAGIAASEMLSMLPPGTH